jgi:dUTP pyrophosphatase
MILFASRPTTRTSKLPQYQTKGSAGFDIESDETVEIPPGQWRTIKTGLFIESCSSDLSLFVCSRSGLAAKHGVAVLNAPGIVDSSYRQEIGVILINLGQKPFIVNPGDRIAQGVIMQVSDQSNLVILDAERTGGFGSTGK